MEKILENMIEGKINDKDVVGIKYNGDILWSKYYVEYTIDVDTENPDEPLDIIDNSNYKYLLYLDDYGVESHNYYEDVIIILKNGEKTKNLKVPVNSVEMIRIFFPIETFRLRFMSSRIKELISINTSNVTSMNSMFAGCKSLTSLDLSNFDTRNVTSMSRMFYNCKSLTSLDLSNFDTISVTDMFAMFSNCTSLTSLDLSNFDTSNVTSMIDMFNKCSSSCKIYIGPSWTLTKKQTSFTGSFIESY